MEHYVTFNALWEGFSDTMRIIICSLIVLYMSFILLSGLVQLVQQVYPILRLWLRRLCSWRPKKSQIALVVSIGCLDCIIPPLRTHLPYTCGCEIGVMTAFWLIMRFGGLLLA